MTTRHIRAMRDSGTDEVNPDAARNPNEPRDDEPRHAQPIAYYQRSNYGNAPRIYVEDAQTAADLERLTGRRTHTLQDLEILTSIGAQFVEIADPRNNQERTSR